MRSLCSTDSGGNGIWRVGGLTWTKKGLKKKKHQYIYPNGQLQPQFDDGEDCGNDNMVGIHGIHFLVGAMLTRSLIF